MSIETFNRENEIFKIKDFKDFNNLDKGEPSVDKFFIKTELLKKETFENKNLTMEEVQKKIAEAHDLIEFIADKTEYARYSATLSALANEMLKSAEKSKIESANA